MTRNKAIVLLALSLLLSFALSGCKGKDDTPPAPEVQAPPQVSQGDKFMTSGYKIRSELKPRSNLSSDSLIFEVYVDAEGDGNGLVGFKDNTYDLHLVAGEVYVIAADDLTVHLTDINARMIPSDLGLSGVDDLKAKGFTILDGEVISYSGNTADMDIVTRFEASTSSFDPVAILQSNNMTSAELQKYFFQTISTTYVEDPVDEDPPPARQSFYANTDFAVTIRGVDYSIGDFCEPYTYFEKAIPQGINTKDEMREDKKVSICYVSYISSDGMSSFMTTDGYVQAISTTSEFSFLDVIKRGMSTEDLEMLLGIGLKKGELESFKPIREGMTAEKKGKVYTIHYVDYTIELETGADKTVESLTITNYLDFRSW